eukprot:TRINITY_DN1210_c0_g1_i22.p1 TRINITY_DN1210_c0_g1~~TRINITY_DN1210_c0_g1_i22.p1  ORF type:complete len:868 (-),score=112.34 TRINITY_DN1210_c0_g1_i22:739-3081(-)
MNRANAPDGCRSRVPYSDYYYGEHTSQYYLCREKYYNFNSQIGLVCRHDRDCVGGICSATGYCLIDNDLRLNGFIQCAINVSTNFILNYISLSIWSVENNVTVDGIRSHFVIPDRCVDPGNVYLRGYTRQISSACPECPPVIMLDEYDVGINYQCNACGGPLKMDVDPTPECNRTFCNWFECDSASDDSCRNECLNTTLAPQFCGLCEDGYQCLDVTEDSRNDQISCESKIGCRLHNGSLIFMTSEEECRSVFSCDSGCIGCLTEEMCMTEGYCTDATDYKSGLWMFGWENLTGGCLYDYRNSAPWDSSIPRCFPKPSLSRPSILGCFDPTISEANCTADGFPYKDDVMSLKAIKFLKKATSQQECESFGTMCIGLVDLEFLGPSDDAILMSSNQTCVSLGGQFRTVYEWIKYSWLGGQPRKLSWRDRHYGRRWRDGSIFDFKSFATMYEDAVRAQYSLILQSAIFCQYSRTNRALDWLVCNCIDGRNASDCYSSQEILGISDIGAFCGGDVTQLVSTPWRFTSSPNTVPKQDCVIIYFEPISIYEYRDTSSRPHVSNVIINYDEDSIWSLRHPLTLAIYAKVLTDGMTVTSQVDTFWNVSVMVSKSSERLNYEHSSFPILDVASAPVNSSVPPRPLGVHVTVSEDGLYYVATLSSMPSNYTYWIVQRRVIWDQISREVLSPGEVAYVSVLLALYVIGLMVSCLKLFRGLYYGSKEVCTVALIRLMIILAFMFVFFVCMCYECRGYVMEGRVTKKGRGRATNLFLSSSGLFESATAGGPF